MSVTGQESVGSFPSMHNLAKASPATSFIAETYTTAEEVLVTLKCIASQAAYMYTVKWLEMFVYRCLHLDLCYLQRKFYILVHAF